MLPLARATTTPPPGAGLDNVTVPVEELPPATVAGLRDKEDTALRGTTVRFPVELALYVPEIVTVVAVVTALVVTLNVAVDAFAGTVTVAGTCPTAVLLLDKSTTAPPIGAGALRDTVPTALPPPSTVMGLRDKLTSDAGFTVSVAVSTPL